MHDKHSLIQIIFLSKEILTRSSGRFCTFVPLSMYFIVGIHGIPKFGILPNPEYYRIRTTTLSF